MRAVLFIVIFSLFNLAFGEESTNNEKQVKTNTFYATYVDKQKWEYGSTLLGFFNKNGIPEKTYFNLSPEDKELVADVRTDSDVFILRDSNGFLLQAFLSLNQDTQVRIFFNQKIQNYELEIIPIISLQTKQKVVARVDSSGPSSALYSATQDARLNGEFLNAYKIRNTMQKGDRVAVIYLRKYRLGRPIGNAEIQAIATEHSRNFNYLFGYENRYYDINGKEMTSFFLITPVKYRRISSKFSTGRKHPVLGYVRPHYGVDLAAVTGTPIKAAGDGRITYSGPRGGYGNAVEISHSGGIRTLYAHMSKIAKNSKVGTWVRQGTVIGYVGSTGLSTGPHLHFGVYKNNKPINPLGQIKTTRTQLEGKKKQHFQTFANDSKAELDSFITNAKLDNTPFFITKELIKEDSQEDEES